MPVFSITKRKFTIKSGQKLNKVTHNGLAHTMEQMWAILIADQLLNNTAWPLWRVLVICPSQVKLPCVASPIRLLDSLTLPLINYCEPNTTTTSYHSHISILGIAKCFNH